MKTTMTRKQFIAIAKAISENSMSKEQKIILAENLKPTFKTANSAFDYSIFLDACLA